MIKNIIAKGVGFTAGSVKWIVTHGFDIGEATSVWTIQSADGASWAAQAGDNTAWSAQSIDGSGWTEQ